MRFDLTKPWLFVVEGAQAGGKSTTSNALRERLIHTQLLRLSGCGCGRMAQSVANHCNVHTFLRDNAHTGLNVVLDRSYLTELVYKLYNGDEVEEYRGRLEASFKEVCEKYNVVVVLLITDTQTFEARLKRDKPDYDPKVEFNAGNSIEQQNAYMHELVLLSKSKMPLDMIIVDNSHLPVDRVVDRILRSSKYAEAQSAKERISEKSC